MLKINQIHHAYTMDKRKTTFMKRRSSSISTAGEEKDNYSVRTCSADSTASTVETYVEKSVSFANTITVQFVLSIEDYTIEEIQSTWYQQDDFERIWKRCHKEIRKLDRGEKLRNKKYCERGIECHTMKGSKTRFVDRTKARYAVLKEQAYQIANELPFNEYAIAQAYQKMSERSLSRANLLGLIDQLDAEQWEFKELIRQKNPKWIEASFKFLDKICYRKILFSNVHLNFDL